MSETITDTTPLEATQEPAEAPQVVETTEAPETAAEAPQESEQPTKPDKVERRIANLTRKMADEARLREAAERRADAAEQLLKGAKGDDDAPASKPAVDIEARATQLVAEREFNRRLADIDSSGKKELGGDAWEQAKVTLTGLGATANPAFLQALAEAENPVKLFEHFSDDTDALMELLNKPPAAMAARIGRLDAQMSKPAARPLSSAPAPAPKVRGTAIPQEPTPTSYPSNMSMREWSKMMDAHLPPSLGGKRAPR